MKHVNPARKSEPVPAQVNTAPVGRLMALMWAALAIAYAAASWIYGARPLIEAYERSTLRGWQLYDVAEFAVGYAFIALATLACAVAAALQLPAYRAYRMDKLWLIAALLGTLSFPIPMLMPDDMKARIGVSATFSWFGLTHLVEILALLFLLGLIWLPFSRQASDEAV